jgi:hypothetical protein
MMIINSKLQILDLQKEHLMEFFKAFVAVLLLWLLRYLKGWNILQNAMFGLLVLLFFKLFMEDFHFTVGQLPKLGGS